MAAKMKASSTEIASRVFQLPAIITRTICLLISILPCLQWRWVVFSVIYQLLIMIGQAIRTVLNFCPRAKYTFERTREGTFGYLSELKPISVLRFWISLLFANSKEPSRRSVEEWQIYWSTFFVISTCTFLITWGFVKHLKIVKPNNASTTPCHHYQVLHLEFI